MRKALIVCFLIVAGAITGSAQTTFYYPQIADGIQDADHLWRTTVFLTNPASAGTASGSVSFTRSNGTPFILSFTDQAGQAISGNVINFEIPAGQSRRYVSAGTQQPLTVGFGTVTSNGSITGTAIFSYYRSNGQLLSEVGVPATLAVDRQAIFVDRTVLPGQGQFDAGVAWANPGTSPATINLQLLNSDGVQVIATTRSLAASSHDALYVGLHLFPTVPAIAGTLKIESPGAPLAVVALRADPTYSLYTSLPPVTLASLVQPALNWLAQKTWLSPLSSIARLLAGVQFSLG